jgi:metal-sulfur cluster biosynthetic enzyme
MSLNANPVVYEAETTKGANNIEFLSEDDVFERTSISNLFKSLGHEPSDLDNGVDEPISEEDVFELVRHINDPEHPLTLEQLRVAQRDLIKVEGRHVDLHFTPTIPHCSMATLIGLSLRVKLLRSLPSNYKVDINITPGTHAQEDQGMHYTLISRHHCLIPAVHFDFSLSYSRPRPQ